MKQQILEGKISLVRQYLVNAQKAYRKGEEDRAWSLVEDSLRTLESE